VAQKGDCCQTLHFTKGFEHGLTRGIFGVGFFASMRSLSSFTSGCSRYTTQLSWTEKKLKINWFAWYSEGYLTRHSKSFTL
jgi:hypothetical protein